jgi:hypothetical protein
MRTVAGFDSEVLALDTWRAVEAQHRASTMVLVDTLDEQALLERLLEQSKPAIADDQASLHWLLFTPFRYPPLPTGSRFRGPADPGVFYGADLIRTACAELGYWRWRFLMDSPELTEIEPKQQTVFRTTLRGTAIDLQKPPWSERHRSWTDPIDYSACQELARQARQAGAQMIRYRSVRDPQPGNCTAVLCHTAFAARMPSESQTWTLAVFRQRVVWRCDSIFEDCSFEFHAVAW